MAIWEGRSRDERNLLFNVPNFTLFEESEIPPTDLPIVRKNMLSPIQV